MKDTLVWDSTAVYDLALSREVGHPWFSDAEIISSIKEIPENFLNDSRRKIAFVNFFFGQGLNIDLSRADLVVALNWELINENFEEHYNIARKHFNNDRIIFILGGIRKFDIEQAHNRFFFPYLSFLNKVVRANEVVEYNYTSPRPYLFDVLLGGIKFHRKIVFDKLYTSGLLYKSLVSMTPAPGDSCFSIKSDYKFTVNNFTDYSSPDLHKYEHPLILDFKSKAVTIEEKHSVNTISTLYYKGNNAYNPSMSFIIPNGIYQNTWYSIVTETNFQPVKFLTEKTAKPLFARRIFVCFGSQGHLRFLREQGYLTFSSIIDESYDDELDHVLRFEMAWQQVLKLATMDPIDVYSKVMPILEHNFQLINKIEVRMEQVQQFIENHWNKLPL